MTIAQHTNKPKQVLVWRADLRNAQGNKVRSGKMAAQLAHASMAVLLNAGRYNKAVDEGEVYAEQFSLTLLPELNNTPSSRPSSITRMASRCIHQGVCLR